MHRLTLLRTLRRSGALTAVALASVLAVAGPAAAHAEVEADGARALDQNVELTFSAASATRVVQHASLVALRSRRPSSRRQRWPDGAMVAVRRPRR